ncbi:MAG: SH3 domain-containing protein [Gallionellaceae bacterium]|jgi:SH3-like domain-containing protein
MFDCLCRQAQSILFCGLLGIAAGANAFDFVSVATPAILYDAPSLKANKLFVATRYLPLEQIVSLDNWVKVRDSSGKLFWIEKRALSSKRYVTVILIFAAVRESPDINSAIVFQAPQQLALEWLEKADDGWLKVRHLDGTTGFIKSTEVWGGQ